MTGARARLVRHEISGSASVWIFCPGCDTHHALQVTRATNVQVHPDSPTWTWNSDVERPTFSPSLLCNQDDPRLRCHTFIRDGRIEYLGDCWHGLKGQTVDLPLIAESMGAEVSP